MKWGRFSSYVSANPLSIAVNSSSRTSAASKHAVDMVAFYAVLISAGLFATTIHAQDFQDIPGDRMIGRKTLPIVHPRLARFSLMILLPLWSILLAYTWRLGIIACYMTNVLSLYVGWRFLKLADVDSDQQSYVWYNVSSPNDILHILQSK